MSADEKSHLMLPRGTCFYLFFLNRYSFIEFSLARFFFELCPAVMLQNFPPSAFMFLLAKYYFLPLFGISRKCFRCALEDNGGRTNIQEHIFYWLFYCISSVLTHTRHHPDLPINNTHSNKQTDRHVFTERERRTHINTNAQSWKSISRLISITITIGTILGQYCFPVLTSLEPPYRFS